MDLKRLAEPFHQDDIEWRAAQVGDGKRGPWAKVLAYLTSRAIMSRLDEVCGVDGWWNEYRTGPSGGVLCGITIRTSEGPITKWDGAENTAVEEIKGGLSSAFKRAAVPWGIGRYLYSLPEGWAVTEHNGRPVDRDTPGSSWAKTKTGVEFFWVPPDLPGWALPGGRAEPSPEQRPADADKPKFGTKVAKANPAYSEFEGSVRSRLQGDAAMLWGKSPELAWNSFKAWVTSEAVSEFSSWAEVEACTDRGRLRGVWDAMVAESRKRQEGEIPF